MVPLLQALLFRPVTRIDLGGGVRDPQKGGLFLTSPPYPPTKTQFLAHFVAKSGPFGRLGGASHPPHPPPPPATGLLLSISSSNSFHYFHSISAYIFSSFERFHNFNLAQRVLSLKQAGGRKRLPKFKFSAKFPIGLHVILQIQIKKNRKWLLYYVKNYFNRKSVEVQRWTPLEIMLNGFCL